MQNCLLNIQPSAFSHQKGAPCESGKYTQRIMRHEARSNLSFLPGRFQGSPCRFTPPFAGAYRDRGGGSETVGFQFFLPDVIHLVLVGLLGSHIWFWKWRAYLKPYELGPPPPLRKKDFWLSKWCNKSTIREERFLHAPWFQESDNRARTIALSSAGRELVFVQVRSTKWIWRLSQLAVSTPLLLSCLQCI